jgi:hypothetical protein
MSTATKAPTRVPDFPTSPSVDVLEAKLDDWAELHEQAQRRAAKLRAEKKALELSIRVEEDLADRIEQYLQTQLRRCDVESIDAEAFRARLQQNSRPSFEVLGDAKKLPAAFRVEKYSLNDKAALAAWAAKKLPKCVKATLGTHVRIERVNEQDLS